MLRIRHLIRPLVVVALLATSLALAAASPAGAQSGIKVFTFQSGEDGADAADWEIQITTQALGGCNPTNARSGYVTSWIGTGDEDGEVLDPGVCNYRITAVARKSDTPSQLCDAEVRWGESGTYQAALTTSDAARSDATTVQAQHIGAGNPSCSAQPTLSIWINPEDIVQQLPDSAKDSNLTERAERAAEITDFRVKVTPESSSINRTGCDQTLDFFVTGDGETAEKALSSLGAGVNCNFRITVTEAPPPFVITDANGEGFSTNDKNINTGLIDLDLSDHVELPYNRIVIIQDVVNNVGNQGTAAYTISTECGGVAALPPIAISPGGSGIYTTSGGETVATLVNGRFTVHSPTFANFGAGAAYPAVATSTTSDNIGGCSVTAAVDVKAPDCSLTGSANRTLTWTTANPLRNFDFEFDYYCGGSRPPDPPPTPTTQPATGDGSGDADETDDAEAVSGTDMVRLVARLLENGKIEFGLQQRQHDETWGDRIFPRARLFPADTAVGRWLVSSAITLSVSESADTFADDAVVRIIARKQSNGRVEFGLQQSDDGGDTWGDRMLPTRRYFPTSATALSWLGSSNITVDS